MYTHAHKIRIMLLDTDVARCLQGVLVAACILVSLFRPTLRPATTPWSGRKHQFPPSPALPSFCSSPFWCDCYSIRRVPSLNGYSSTFSAPVACVCVRVVAGGGSLWAATVAGREYLVPSGFTGEIYCQSVLALRRGNEQRALFSLPIPFRLGIPSFPGLLCVIVLFFGNGFEGANA